MDDVRVTLRQFPNSTAVLAAPLNSVPLLVDELKEDTLQSSQDVCCTCTCKKTPRGPAKVNTPPMPTSAVCPGCRTTLPANIRTRERFVTEILLEPGRRTNSACVREMHLALSANA